MYRGKEKFLVGAMDLESCQVRSGREHPCPQRAVVKIQGIPFCKRCAREQETYFTIGELTRGLAGDREERT